MANKRTDRVAEAYQHGLSELLCYKIRDPRLAGVSVTNVVFTPDLSLAKIYFRVPEGKARESQVIEGFEKSKGFLKRELAQKINIRYVPDLKFYYDEHVEMRSRIDELFQEIKNEKSEKH